MVKTNLLMCVLAIFSAAIMGPGAARAQEADWPSRPVRIVVPFPPGGTTDILAREVGQRMAVTFKQTFVVDNRAGASGAIGLEHVARAAPDGYTLVIGSPQTLTINPHLFKLNFRPMEDFAPIVIIASVPNVLVVNPKLPARTVGEVVELARKSPGRLNYASTSIGGTPHLTGEMLKRVANVDIQHVPYKGSAPALADLIAGHVEMMFDNLPSALPYVRSGQLRAIAVTTSSRSPVLPELPTFGEQGMSGFESQGWFSILGPKGTPSVVVERINAEVNRLIATDDFKQKLIQLGSQPVGGSPEFFARHMRDESERWGALIRSAGIKAE